MSKLFALMLAIVYGLAAGCQSEPERHYAIQAEVVSTDAPHKLLTVKHGEIPGLMSAMTMTYMVAEPRQIEKLQPGDKISADLVASESKGRLEKIKLVSERENKTSPSVQ